MIGTILGGIGLASGIANTITSAVQGKRQRDEMAKANATMQEYYRKQLAQDPLARADNQAAIKAQREMLSDAVKSARARQIVGGASDDSVTLAKMGASKSLADTMTNMAVRGEQHKDQLQQAAASGQAQYHNTMATLAAQRSADNARAAASAFGSAGQILSSSGAFQFPKRQSADNSGQAA